MFRGCPLKIKGYQSNFKPYLVKRISIKIYYKLLYGINKRSNSKELRHLPSVKAASAMTSWNILGYRCSFSLPRMLVTSLAPSSMFSSSSSWRAWKYTVQQMVEWFASREGKLQDPTCWSFSQENFFLLWVSILKQ